MSKRIPNGFLVNRNAAKHKYIDYWGLHLLLLWLMDNGVKMLIHLTLNSPLLNNFLLPSSISLLLSSIHYESKKTNTDVLLNME